MAVTQSPSRTLQTAFISHNLEHRCLRSEHWFIWKLVSNSHIMGLKTTVSETNRTWDKGIVGYLLKGRSLTWETYNQIALRKSSLSSTLRSDWNPEKRVSPLSSDLYSTSQYAPVATPKRTDLSLQTTSCFADTYPYSSIFFFFLPYIIFF